MKRKQFSEQQIALEQVRSGLSVEEVSRINERWSMDFMSDCLADGRRIRWLTVIDVFTRECLVLKGARSIPARAVTAALEAVIAQRGKPWG